MQPGSVQYRTLRKALAITGSIQRLAEVLGVAVEQLAPWVEGREEVPMPVFFNVVDFLLEQPGIFITPAAGRTVQGEAPTKNGSEDL
jgi:hypothetical protein